MNLSLKYLYNEFCIQQKRNFKLISNSEITVLPKITPFSPGSDAFFPGDYFSVQCSIIHGDLPIKIYWKFNDHIVESNNELLISNMGSRSSVLTIESIRDYHAGNYSCFGKNAAGMANHSVALVVNGSKLTCFCFDLNLIFFVFISVSTHLFIASFFLILLFANLLFKT